MHVIMIIPRQRTEMSKKRDAKISGRAVADEKGNQKWVWQSAEAGDVDTAVVRALGEGLTLDGSIPGASSPGGGSNPYDSSRSLAADKEPAKRRTLDDMRKLSEAIKRSKQTTRD